MFDKMEWYTKHAKKLDKKYYAKGESIYVLHRRTLQTAKSIIDLINDIPADDLFLELYMLVKDKEFGSFVGRYQYVLEIAKEKPDTFAEQLYEFYLKMSADIKKNNYYQGFFEFMSYFQNEDMRAMDAKRQLVYRAYVNLLMNQTEFLRKNKFELNKMVAGVTTKGELIEVDDICPSLDFCVHEIEHIALMTPTQGETAGFYNTQTKQFVSMFTHTEEQTTLLGNYIENTILWCYAAFVGSDTSILPTSESYNEYLSDPTAEITFTSIGGKLRVPTETKHIRTIAGDDRYETEIKHISGYIRKLPDGQKASERAVTLAQSLGYDLADNETYVQPFERSSWIISKKS